MSLEFKKISGSTPYLLNSASTAEELTLALEDYMRTGAQIIFTHDGEDCLLSSFEYKSGIESTVIAYFVTPKKKLLKVDVAAGFDLVITESEFTPETDTTLTQSGKPADAKATGEAINSVKTAINTLHANVEIWLVGLMEQPMNYAELTAQDGGTVEIHLVEQLPDTLTPVDIENMKFTTYVVESTGIAYCNLGGTVMTLGQLMVEGADGFDKGWSTDVTAETETGIYCVREYKDFAEKKDITWENLPDKPFGEITESLGDTITWDGNIDEGNDIVTNTTALGTGTFRYIKVANSVPTIDDVGDNSTFKNMGENGIEQTPETINIYDEDNGIIRISSLFSFVFIVPNDNSEWADIVFPEKGVYFMQSFNADGKVITYCASLTIPNYNFGTKTTIKKIDEKYLPEAANGIADVDELPTRNIDEKLVYRIKSGLFFYAYNNYTRHGKAYIVDELPETGEPCTLDGETINAVYYERKTNDCYVYVPSSIAPALGVPAGWYTVAMLLGALGYTWGGIVTSVEDMKESGNFYFLKTPYYGAYSNGTWTELSKSGGKTVIKGSYSDSNPEFDLTDEDVEKIRNDFLNTVLDVVTEGLGIHVILQPVLGGAGGGIYGATVWGFGASPQYWTAQVNMELGIVSIEIFTLSTT